MAQYDKNIKPLIFMGPSISIEESKNILEIEVIIHPPIQRGDLKNIPENTQVILIIDGFFYNKRAVSPFEIKDIIERKIYVMGASSMGALRAAELYPLGMKGIGEVFNMYKYEKITSDADVALIFDENTLQPLTEPMINIRYAVMILLQENKLSYEEANLIIFMAENIYFPELTYNRLFIDLKNILPTSRIDIISDIIISRKNEFDIKHKDACLAIMTLNNLYK